MEEHRARREAAEAASAGLGAEKREEDLVDVLLSVKEKGGLEFPLTETNIKAVLLRRDLNGVRDLGMDDGGADETPGGNEEGAVGGQANPEEERKDRRGRLETPELHETSDAGGSEAGTRVPWLIARVCNEPDRDGLPRPRGQ
ncbi:uncharacterized protein A4U43_C06F1820 [Asparagus officinalis]|uniref:Uncharacterized protein n=1 Tax=Asparagus officinalis TaxID=4686 RepID=A0A5P1EPB1_ASPOF|nr:uncharacterized protein A4U43_C06F1820 [Asparagus officinalis]